MLLVVVKYQVNKMKQIQTRQIHEAFSRNCIKYFAKSCADRSESRVSFGSLWHADVDNWMLCSWPAVQFHYLYSEVIQTNFWHFSFYNTITCSAVIVQQQQMETYSPHHSYSLSKSSPKYMSCYERQHTAMANYYVTQHVLYSNHRIFPHWTALR